MISKERDRLAGETHSAGLPQGTVQRGRSETAPNGTVISRERPIVYILKNLSFQRDSSAEKRMAVKSLPHPDHLALLRGRPDADDIFAVANTHNSTTDVNPSIVELVSNEGKHQILPVPIRNTLLQPHQPLPAVPVLVVLPNGAHALLEQVIVADRVQARGSREVPVDRPELLGCGYLGQAVDGLDVGNGDILGDRGAEPEAPGVLQRGLRGLLSVTAAEPATL